MHRGKKALPSYHPKPVYAQRREFQESLGSYMSTQLKERNLRGEDDLWYRHGKTVMTRILQNFDVPFEINHVDRLIKWLDKRVHKQDLTTYCEQVRAWMERRKSTSTHPPTHPPTPMLTPRPPRTHPGEGHRQAGPRIPPLHRRGHSLVQGASGASQDGR